MGQKNAKRGDILPIFLGGQMGPIQPVWGHLVMFGKAGSISNTMHAELDSDSKAR